MAKAVWPNLRSTRQLQPLASDLHAATTRRLERVGDVLDQTLERELVHLPVLAVLGGELPALLLVHVPVGTVVNVLPVCKRRERQPRARSKAKGWLETKEQAVLGEREPPELDNGKRGQEDRMKGFRGTKQATKQ